MRPESYAKLVAEAEAAVAAVKNPELRYIAFQKILEVLLKKRELQNKSKAKRPKRLSPRGKNKRPKRLSPRGRNKYGNEWLSIIDDGL